MSKSTRNALFLLVCLPLAACAATFDASFGIRSKGTPIKSVTLSRVRVFRGPIAYIGKVECEAPVSITIPEVVGVDAIAFLRTDKPLEACGREWASIVLRPDEALGPNTLGALMTSTGYVVGCVRGASRPSEVVVNVVCR